MAVCTGAGADSSMKLSFGGVFWKNNTCDIPDTDITLFMAFDTPHRRYACQGLMTTQTLFLQGVMSVHQSTGVKQHLREHRGKSSENDG